jgi:ketopantoate reductase
MDVKSIGKADLVIFFVKTYHTEKAVSDALSLEHSDTVFLTLQNGLGNEEAICKQINPKKVMLGVTGQGATLMGPAHPSCRMGKNIYWRIGSQGDGTGESDCQDISGGRDRDRGIPEYP